jgi:hypothetical protein
MDSEGCQAFRARPPSGRLEALRPWPSPGLPRDLQRAARVRAVREGTTLRRVLLQGLREYAAGTWTPKSEDP